MPTLKYLDKSFACATAIKGDDYIHLMDDKGILIAAFDHISDFSGFTLEDGSYVSPTADHNCKVAVIRDDGTIAPGSHTCADIGNAVPKTRTVNGKTLDQDVTITAEELNAVTHDNIYIKREVLLPVTNKLFGLPENATPNDVLTFLGKFNQHWWKRRTSIPEAIPSGYTLAAAADFEGEPSMSHYQEGIIGSQIDVGSATIHYGTAVSVADNGAVTIVNAQTTTVEALAKRENPRATSEWSGEGLFFSVEELGDTIYFDGTLSVTSATVVNYRSVELTGAQVVEGYPATTEAITGEWEYIQAFERSDYPESGIAGIYEYKYLGVPFQNMLHDE